MRRRLPPLKALLAFETVVRQGGVSAAADELGVTHGAVSKQVALLEDWFGRRLLDRTGPRPIPLPEAAAFAARLRACFDDIVDGTRQLASRPPRSFQILAPATFAMRWLVPRLARFQEQNPALEVTVQATHTKDDWRSIPSDLAIRRGDDTIPDWPAVPFLGESITLVGTPALAARFEGRPVQALRDAVLLASETRPSELERWLESAGLGRRSARRPLVFGHFYLALEAAISGMGFVAAPLPVVADELAAGRLAVPFPGIAVAGPGYRALHDPQGPNTGTAALFARWLVEEGRRSMDAMAGTPGEAAPLFPSAPSSARGR